MSLNVGGGKIPNRGGGGFLKRETGGKDRYRIVTPDKIS